MVVERRSYVVVGNGAAGVAAIEALRARDPSASIRVVSAEAGPAYSRVLLHHLVAGDVGEDVLTIRDYPFYQEKGVDLIHGRVDGVDVANQRLRLSDGRSIPYDSLLIATGGSAWRPPIPGLDLPEVHCLWTLEDARAVSALVRPGGEAVVMGAGFVGIQAVDALAVRGLRVTLLDIAERVLPLMLDTEAARMVAAHLEDRGVRLRMGSSVQVVSPRRGGGVWIELDGGEALGADLMVVATGARPNVGFLEGSSVRVDRGVLVDDCMATDVPNIFAAGDVVVSRDLVTGQPVNCALWPVAVDQGLAAAAAMVGRPVRYPGALRVNITSALGLSVGSVGSTNESADVQSDCYVDQRRRRYRRVFFREDRLVGAMLVGNTSDLGMLSSLIRQRCSVSLWRDEMLAQPISYGSIFSALGRDVGSLGAVRSPG